MIYLSLGLSGGTSRSKTMILPLTFCIEGTSITSYNTYTNYRYLFKSTQSISPLFLTNFPPLQSAPYKIAPTFFVVNNNSYDYYYYYYWFDNHIRILIRNN